MLQTHGTAERAKCLRYRDGRQSSWPLGSSLVAAAGRADNSLLSKSSACLLSACSCASVHWRGHRIKSKAGSDNSDAHSEINSDDVRSNFVLMSVCFALNHGVVTTPLAVATTLLQLDVANFGNGLLYAVTLVSSLFLGAPAVGRFGPKGGLVFGMFFYCIYIGLFALALFYGDATQLLFTIGSACGGLAAGVLWTAQGAYFACSATELSKSTEQSRENATAELSSQFAFYYLLLEVFSKLGFSGLQALGLQVSQIGLIYFGAGVLSLIGMTQVYDFRSAASDADPLSKALAAASLWSDPTLWLLAPTNLAFGFCAAYMNGFVNATFAAQELGAEYVAFLGAVTALTAAVLAKAYGPLGAQIGKGPIIVTGAVCAFAIPALTWQGCTGWGWFLISLYLLQGSFRAVYESTNRATFSDFFPGEKTEGAFANCMLQSSFGFATCFFLQNSLSPTQLSTIVVVLALSTPVGYLFAESLRSKASS